MKTEKETLPDAPEKSMQGSKLLDILAEERILNELETVLADDGYYQETLERQERADKELEQTGLSKEQDKAVTRLLAAKNANSAAYGAAAYRLGLKDGIQLLSELKEIK